MSVQEPRLGRSQPASAPLVGRSRVPKTLLYTSGPRPLHIEAGEYEIRDKDYRPGSGSGWGLHPGQRPGRVHSSSMDEKEGVSSRVLKRCGSQTPAAQPFQPGCCCVGSQVRRMQSPGLEDSRGAPSGRSRPPSAVTCLPASEAHKVALCGSWLQTRVSVWGSTGQPGGPALQARDARPRREGPSCLTLQDPGPSALQEETGLASLFQGTPWILKAVSEE